MADAAGIAVDQIGKSGIPVRTGIHRAEQFGEDAVIGQQRGIKRAQIKKSVQIGDGVGGAVLPDELGGAVCQRYAFGVALIRFGREIPAIEDGNARGHFRRVLHTAVVVEQAPIGLQVGGV